MNQDQYTELFSLLCDYHWNVVMPREADPEWHGMTDTSSPSREYAAKAMEQLGIVEPDEEEYEPPAFYDDHDAMIALHDGEFYNYGWATGDTYITSKTSVGILHTEVDEAGTVTHLWLPGDSEHGPAPDFAFIRWVAAPLAPGFSKDITEPIPATFPELPADQLDADGTPKF
jgi:hypothetical protein